MSTISSTPNTGSFLDNFVDSISFLPVDMPKNLALMRELDQKCAELVRDAETKCQSLKNTRNNKRSKQQQSEVRNEINQQLQEAVDLSEEKVQLSIQCYEMVDKSIRKLDDQLAKFAQLLTTEKNANFIPQISNSLLFSSDSIKSPYNERHAININVPHNNEGRLSSLKSTAALKGPALSGTTRATRLMASSSDTAFSDEFISMGEDSDTPLRSEERKKGAVGRSRRQSTTTLATSSNIEDDDEHMDIFSTNNTVTTQETPILDIKITKAAPLKDSSTATNATSSSTTKKKGTKRSRTISRTEGSAPQRRRLDPSADKSLHSHLPRPPILPPRPVKDNLIQEDHAFVSATHSGVMSMASFNKDKGEPMGAKGAIIGLKGAALGMMQQKAASNNKKKKNQVDILQADLPVDPNEPVYCYCRQVSYGPMVACDNENCEREWFHFGCVGLTAEPKGTWYCPDCRKILGKK